MTLAFGIPIISTWSQNWTKYNFCSAAPLSDPWNVHGNYVLSPFSTFEHILKPAKLLIHKWRNSLLELEMYLAELHNLYEYLYIHNCCMLSFKEVTIFILIKLLSFAPHLTILCFDYIFKLTSFNKCFNRGLIKCSLFTIRGKPTYI